MTSSSHLCSTAKQGRLEQLGITYELFGRYFQMFCSTRERHRYLIRNQNGWSTIKRQWDESLILRHLAGEFVIGLFPAIAINYLMFDIDNHGDTGFPSPELRCRSVVQVFEPDPLVYTSSQSNGLRVCYFLDREYSRAQVKKSAEQQLRKHDVQIGTGFIEIMADGRGDRLPFGAGSYLVDPNILAVRCEIDLEEKIAHAWQVYNSTRLSLPVVRAKKTNSAGNRFRKTIKTLIEQGLDEKRTTTDALLKLCYWLRVNEGLGAEKTKERLRYWIEGKHNGLSKRVNAGKIANIFSQIDRIVVDFDSGKVKWWPSGNGGTDPRLRVDDVRQILEYFPAYRDQLAAFSMLQYVKCRGHPEDQEGRNDTLLVTPNILDGVDTKDSEKKGNLIRVPFSQYWVCEIPYKTFRSFDGFYNRKPKRTIDRLLQPGLLEVCSDWNHTQHKCRAYRVRFTFASESSEVKSLDEALREMKSPKQLISDYGRYRSRKIRKRE